MSFPKISTFDFDALSYSPELRPTKAGGKCAQVGYGAGKEQVKFQLGDSVHEALLCKWGADPCDRNNPDAGLQIKLELTDKSKGFLERLEEAEARDAEVLNSARESEATAAQRRRSMQAAGSHADAGGGRGGGGGGGGGGDHDVTDTGAVGAAAEGNPSGGAEEAAACDVLADGSGTDSALTSLDGDTLALSAAELPVGLVERMSALRSDPSRDFRTAASVQDAGPVNRCSPMEQM